jgi:predicted CXXCH cytochrome family protein
MPDETLAAPVKGMAADVHNKPGLGCSGCHGGDPSAVDDMAAAHATGRGFRGAPSATSEPDLCGRCHADPIFMKKFNPNMGVDQLKLYRTSVHGTKNSKGDTKVAHCTSCHGIHGIRPANDPQSPVFASNVPRTCSRCHADAQYMKAYGIPVDQMAEYETSVHGVALLEKGDRSAPACNDCHGNHGAVPPGVGSVSEVCGQCHSLQASLFAASPHGGAFTTMGLPACEACHGNHAVKRPTDAMLGVRQGAVCLDCHDEGSGGFAAARNMASAIDSLNADLARVTDLVDRAEQAGMMMDEARFEANEARDALMRARTAVHAFSPAAVGKETATGVSTLARARKVALDALSEISSRRRWLAALVAAVVVMILVLARKVRKSDAECRERRDAGPPAG